ncbi:type VI secretion system protein TssR domain-containing protein [uncultured Fibrella sp.]|uniref:type VI secretion system protein TssR domain-containing protein n=1 Tax=uncultured Fibrella sp. TaxID=1284596 RepID=UPI0035CBD111
MRLFCLILLLLITGFTGQAQGVLPPFASLKRPPVPTASKKGPQTQSLQSRGKAALAGPPQLGTGPWIVFADRNNVPTYHYPRPTTRFKQINFRDAFYVLKEKDGYLNLIKYDAALKVGTWYAPRLLKDRKSAVAYGWAPKSSFLTTTKAQTAPDSDQPSLYCAALTSGRLLAKPVPFLVHDTLRLYTEPGGQQSAGRGLRLYDIAYIYKLSESGKEALIGRSPWFPTDSISKHLMGWAPTEALQPLGHGLFWESDSLLPNAPAYPFFSTAEAAWQNRPDSAQGGPNRSNLRYEAVAWQQTGVRFPVLQACSVKGQQTVWQLGTLLPLFQTDSSVLNVNGQRLTHRQYQNWRDRSRSENIVYVVEGTRAMLPYWGDLVNTVQASATLLADSTNVRQGSVGIVIYRPGEASSGTRTGYVNSFPIGRDIARAADFLNRAKPSNVPSYDGYAQPIRAGLERALAMLATHPGETNTVIMVGINGDTRDISQLSDIRSGMQASEARFLSFQVEAPADTLANSYVLQAEQLVYQSAIEASQPKRERLVSPALVVPAPAYDLTYGVSNIYRLAFPNASMSPGWVLFPRKRQQLPFSLLHAVTDSLLRQMRFDAQRVDGALSDVFRSQSIYRSRINPVVNRTLKARLEPTLASVDPALFANRAYPFMGQTYVRTADSLPAAFRPIRLLSLADMDRISLWINHLAADELDPLANTDRLKLIRRYDELARQQGQSQHDTATVADLMATLTGLPCRHALLTSLPIRALADPDLVSPGVWLRLLYLIRERRDYLARLPTFPNSRFTSNGHTYYWLSSDLFK